MNKNAKTKSKSKLKVTSELDVALSPEGIVTLLLKDHKAMRVLMKKIKSHRAAPAQIRTNFKLLEKLVLSHVKAEEFSLLKRIEHHPKFEDHAKESIEEHHIHESVLVGIRKLKSTDRQLTQIKIFCELLKDHIDEEEEELFPQFKRYSALSTRKKMGTLFIQRRKQTHRPDENLGALTSVKVLPK
ncbi:MAG: hemerythrin domain-containing protein [Bdellovibrionaceae bacterium]|nr:hemerythrin domain-containing protein [Bdellovibrio sp.]